MGWFCMAGVGGCHSRCSIEDSLKILPRQKNQLIKFSVALSQSILGFPEEIFYGLLIILLDSTLEVLERTPGDKFQGCFPEIISAVEFTVGGVFALALAIIETFHELGTFIAERGGGRRHVIVLTLFTRAKSDP